MVPQSLAADPQLSVVQSGNAVAQGAESGWQLGEVSFKELRHPPDAAAQAVPPGLRQRGILLNRGENVGQGGLKKAYWAVG